MPDAKQEKKEEEVVILMRYAMLINGESGETLCEDKIIVMDGIIKEKERIKQKVLDTKLNPNERKKITSKKLGKWLSMSDDSCLICIVCVENEYPERLAYKMMNDIFLRLIEVYGEDDYFTQSADAVKSSIGDDFKSLVKKYDKPASFDKLVSANAKVDLAKQKMAANLQQAMANGAALNNLNSKTADLLSMAKDFHSDACALEN